MNILIPTDFSDNAQNAINFAISLFGKEATYVLFHSYYIEYRKSTMFVNIDEKLRREAERSMNAQLSLSNKRHPGVSFKTELAAGEMIEEVINTNAKYYIDYVIMGTKGASGIEEVLVGSNTADVVTHIDKPVITVPAGIDQARLNHFMFAIDLKHINKSIALEPLLVLCKANKAKLTLLHVQEEEEESEQEMEEEISYLKSVFKEIPFKIETKVSSEVELTINDFALEIDADIVVMLARKESFFHTLAHPSLSKKISMHSKLPLLVLHDEKAK